MKRILIMTALMLAGLTASAQYVTLSGIIQASNGLSASNYSISFTPSQFGFIAGTGVLINTTTFCGTSTDGSVVGLPNPTVASIITAAFTGTLPAGNYYVKYTWQTGTGTVTLASPESVVNLTATGSIIVPPPTNGVPGGAAQMNVYVGTSSGSETFQGSITAGTTYTQSVPLVSGSALPASNNTVCKQVANDTIWPVGTGYTVALIDPNGNTQPGYPMMWQLLGPNTTINLSNGLPYYHGVVTFPSPILASPLNAATQYINGGLSTTGFFYNGTPGYSGTASYCVLTVQGGIITSTSGCGGGGGPGVTSINSNTGAFAFTGSGVSCTGTTCTFSGTGSGVTSVATGAGLVGGPITSTGTISIPNGGVTNAMLAGYVAPITITISAFSASPNTCYNLSGGASWTQSTGSPSPTTTTMTGLTTAMAPHWTPQGEISQVIGWGATNGMQLTIRASALNTLASEVCNVTASTIPQGGFIANVEP